MSKILLSVIISFSFFLFTANSVFAQTTFKVLKVIDGDTIQVDVRGNKETVRLLGINTPESVDPRRPVQCFGKAASHKMKSFASGKSVILVDEKATQGNRDKYGRLLRYVYLPDSKKTFVNGEMVKQGYAFSYKHYPTKFINKFNAWETYAKDNNLGLWGSCPINPATAIKPIINSSDSDSKNSRTTNPNPVNSSGGFTCAGKTKCNEMTSCAEANYYLNTCGVRSLDGNKDNVPCESICR